MIQTTRVRRIILFGSAMLVAVLAALVASGPTGEPSSGPWLVASLSLAYLAVELVPLRLTQGGRLSISVGVAVVSMTMLPLTPAILAQCVGQLVSHAFDDEEWDTRTLVLELARRAIALFTAFGVYAITLSLLPDEAWGSIAALAIAGFSYSAIDLLAYVSTGHNVVGVSVWRSLRSLVGLVGWAYLSQLSVGLVFVLVVDGLGFLAAPVLLLLGLLLQSSFALLLRVRTAYVSTVGALARLTERQSPETAGHAERVASLCVSAGRQLHMTQESLEGLSFAATLHDIGFLKVEIPGSPDTAVFGLDAKAAEAGAAIIESVEFLAPAARVLRAYVAMAAGTGEAVDSRDGLSAAVLCGACALDHLYRSKAGAISAADLEDLGGLDPIAVYPQVVAALSAGLPSLEATA